MPKKGDTFLFITLSEVKIDTLQKGCHVLNIYLKAEFNLEGIKNILKFGEYITKIFQAKWRKK